MSGSLFGDPTTLSLLGLASGFGQAAMPSRVPIPFGAGLRQASQGMLAGQMQGLQGQLAQQQIEAARINNQRSQMLLGFFGGGQPGQGGGQQQPQSMNASLGPNMAAQAPAPQQSPFGVPSANGSYLLPPVQMKSLADLAMATGQDRAAAQLYGMLGTTAGGAGYGMGPNGMAFAVPGGSRDPNVIFQNAGAEAGGRVGPDTALYGNKAAIDTSQVGPRMTATEGARAPYEPPISIYAPGPGGVMQQQQIPVSDWAARNGASQGGSFIPGPVFAQRVINFENSSGNPAATNPNSTAMGNGQFLNSTWVPLFRETFPQQSASMSDNQVLAQRADPQMAQTMTLAYAQQNAQAFQQAGLPVNATTLGLAHRLGPQGAATVLQAPANTPLQRVLPSFVLAANPDLANPNSTTSSLIGNSMLRYGSAPVDLGGALGAQAGGGYPGAIPGKWEMTPEQSAESSAYGGQSKAIVEAGAKAPVSLQRLDVIDNAAQGFRTGTTGALRLAAGKATADALQGIGITPPSWVTTGAAAGETIAKEGGYLASEMTRSLGSREAAAVFNQVKAIQPNIEMSQGGFQVITNSIRQGLQRDQDLAQFRERWVADPTHSGSIRGMQDAFEQQFPVEAYASRVMPYPVPSRPTALIRNVIYRGPNGLGLWNGNAFVPLGGGNG